MDAASTESPIMRLSDILLMRGLVRIEDIDAALARQRQAGGKLGESLIALGMMTMQQLGSVLDETPAMPRNVAETGVHRLSLINLLLKFMRVGSYETIFDLSDGMKLPQGVVQELVDEAIAQQLLQVLGSANVGIVRYIRYALSDRGRVAASEAVEQSQYLGPAPVSLASFQAQVTKQAVTNEKLDQATLRKGFSDLVMPDSHLRRLAPAISAGRTILLYGPPGNGKTSIGTRVASLFRDVIYIPYAIEVGGQIIKMFDASLHHRFKPATTGEAAAAPAGASASVQLEMFDSRWVACRRPVVMAGGELSLDMLDLRFDPETRYYDAPLHMKALNGVFLIDDFGRQKVAPTDLLNRWIIPLENRIDYLKLHTGMSFTIPFDELVIFSTNLAPQDLMDPAFLRRIPYKMKLEGPDHAEYSTIFERVAASQGLTISQEAIRYVIERLTSANFELAYFQPKFVCEQVSQVCRCFDLKPEMTRRLIDDALANLYVELGPQ